MNTTPSNRREQRALDQLLALIAEGVEYPDAEWRASRQGLDIDCARLRDLYDAHCNTSND